MVKIAREKNPNREKSQQIYIENKGNIKLSDIANMLNEKPSNIRNWKSIDKWDSKISKPGAPKGNKNALGNKGGKGASKGNLHAVKHGLHMSTDRWIQNWDDILPEYIKNNISKSNEDEPLEMLWRNIVILDTQIMSSHKIMEIKNSKDHTKILKKTTKGNVESREYEVLFAQEKESAYSKAISQKKMTLNNMIKTYLELLDQHHGLGKEEKILKIEKLKYEVNSLKIDESEDNEITIVVDYGDEDE